MDIVGPCAEALKKVIARVVKKAQVTYDACVEKEFDREGNEKIKYTLPKDMDHLVLFTEALPTIIASTAYMNDQPVGNCVALSQHKYATEYDRHMQSEQMDLVLL